MDEKMKDDLEKDLRDKWSWSEYRIIEKGAMWALDYLREQHEPVWTVGSLDLSGEDKVLYRPILPTEKAARDFDCGDGQPVIPLYTHPVPSAPDSEEILADKRRLVRELDVLMNGEAGAARQASLCDLVAQYRRSRIADEELRRDAERYRWIRKEHRKYDGVTLCKVKSFGLEPWSGDDPDAVIDAAIADEKETDDE